jgi:MauM/NapG family ferredoxin protein
LLGGAIGGAAGGVAAALGVRATVDRAAGGAAPLVRPPGSVPEPEFLRLCVRCGECFQACPNNVLQPAGLDHGFDNLWTPRVVADWSGCEPSCNNCGQVCPTGAVRALPIEEKRAARMGLAVVNERTCLPHAGREACQMCVDECRMAGYDAIEFVRVGVETDADGKPKEGSGLAAPVVVAGKCVGCGLCQSRCHKINVKAKGLLAETAVRIEAGPGKEDRLLTGSYRVLREAEAKEREADRAKRQGQGGGAGDYLPDFLK